ncbi:hypothetical protein P7C73_g526, partial [Tremellales sp. Uapishka_1]
MSLDSSANRKPSPSSPSDMEKGAYDEPAVIPVLANDVENIDEKTEGYRQMFTFQDGERLKRKADWRLLSLLALCYLLKNLDANVVSYVLTINQGTPDNILKSLHMTKNSYSYVSTVFTALFCLAEIPSNITIKWATPRLHFTRILILWSITCACTAACTNRASLYACRALLGLFEGGLWPGVCYQLSCWYRPDEMAVRATMLISLAQFSTIIDALLTFGLSYANGHGMAGWQWSFVITGILGLFLAVVVFFCLPDWPDSPPSRRQFLTPEEGAFMVARLPPNSSRSSDSNFDWRMIKKDLSGALLWSIALLQMCGQVGSTGLTFWLPSILSSWGITNRQTSALLTIPTAALYIMVSFAFGYFLDRHTRFPKPTFMIIAQVATIGKLTSSPNADLLGFFIGMIFCRNKAGLYVLICLAYCGVAVFQTSIIPMRAMTTKGSASAAFAYAFNNTLGNSVGLYSAQIFRSQYAPDYAIPFAVCVVFLFLSIVAICVAWWKCKDIEIETRRVLKERQMAAKENKVALAELSRDL